MKSSRNTLENEEKSKILHIDKLDLDNNHRAFQQPKPLFSSRDPKIKPNLQTKSGGMHRKLTSDIPLIKPERKRALI